jgi:F-type H+-transporting ATPase subunit b
MNHGQSKARTVALAVSLALVLLCLSGPAEVLAADQGGWRPTYDLVMRWLNFFILAGLLVKFSRAPLRNFLEGRRKEIARAIRQAEENLTQITARSEEARQQVEENKRRLEGLRARIIAQGERRKEAIIDSARHESRLMIENAKMNVEGQLLQARQQLKAELVDAAIALAMERLPAQMTPEDRRNLLEDYFDQALAW